MYDNGYRQITTSTKPILKPEDLQGLKIRVPPSPLWTSMFKAFGSAPASINFSETYSALQTKVVEGQENPLAIIKAAKLYEVQKYLSQTNHMWDGLWMLANGKGWEKLPANVQGRSSPRTSIRPRWSSGAEDLRPEQLAAGGAREGRDAVQQG